MLKNAFFAENVFGFAKSFNVQMPLAILIVALTQKLLQLEADYLRIHRVFLAAIVWPFVPPER